MKKNNKNSKKSKDFAFTKAFITQPISQPDSREEGSNAAIPNLENVIRNKKFVEENEK